MVALVTAIVFSLCSTSLFAKGWWVNGSVSQSGSGTQGSPFKTITQAINASGTGDVITVETGTYCEILSLKGGTVGSPYTLQSDSNARVVVTGYSALPTSGSWSIYSSGSSGTVYTTTVGWAARDLFIGNLKQRIARVPAVGQQWALVQSCTNNIITLTSSLGVTISSGSAASCFAYVWGQTNQFYTAYPVSAVNGNTITLTSTAAIYAGDTLVLANHPSLIQSNGDWAYAALSGSTTQYYYQTANSSDLNTLQARKVCIPITVNGVSNVVIDGIEVSGGGEPGIRLVSSTNVVVEYCLVHHNSMETAGYSASGLLADSCNNITIQNSVICCNACGIGSTRTNLNITGTSNGITIKQCEIAYNEGDGIDIAGTGTYTNPTNSLVQQCYVHNSIGQEHPDDLQIYTDVSNLTVDSCYLTQAGQNIMSQENNGVTVTNNVFSISLARDVIIGHGDSRNWTFSNNTFVWPVGQIPIGMDVTSSGAPNLTARNDIYYNAKMDYVTGTTPAPSFDTDYSVYWSGTGSTDYVADRSSPWTNYLAIGGTSSQLYIDLGQELHSYHADPQLRNVPKHSACALPSSSLTVLNLTYNYGKSTTGFSSGDYIEVNGDGIPRKILSVITGTSITIDTPLSDYVAQRGWIVVNWGPTPSLTGSNTFQPMDTRLPVGSTYLTSGTNGSAIGSTIDTTGYVNGDLNGDGYRDIPVVPADVTSSWITYGSFPYFGIAGYTAKPVITSPLTATGTNGYSFTYQITASGSATSFDAVGLPSGLSVNTLTGLISGTPAVTGTVSITITASNNGGTGTATLVLTLLPPPPGITSPMSATGTNGSAFSYQIAGSNNPTGFNATSLPSGLGVNTSTGVISGTPTVTGTFYPVLIASNAGGSGSATMVLTILPPPPVITSALSATGTNGSAFSYTISASNSPTGFGASGLPSGLSVNTTTGVISGTPTATGTSSVTISASNAGGTGSATLTLIVLPTPPSITSALTATGSNGLAFSYTITASNNPTGFGASGLPSGLSVNTTTGVISGTPAATGTSSVTISASNAGGTGSATLTLAVVAAPPVINSSLTATGTASTAFSYTITATNSPTSFGASGLPNGLGINTSTGVISGTLAATGTFSVVISATNASGSGSATLTLSSVGHLLYMGFDYPTTNNIATVSVPSSMKIGFTGTWTGNNGNDKVITPGLTYSGLNCIGNAIQFANNSAADRSIDMTKMPSGYMQVDTDGTTRLGSPGTTLWFRFLIRPDAADASGTLGACLNLNGAASGGTVKLSVGITGTTGKWAISKGTTYGYSNTSITTGTVVMLVARVQFVAGTNNDQVDLFVNPPLGATPPGTPDATLRNLDIGTFDRIEFKGNRQSTSDEFSMATDWSLL